MFPPQQMSSFNVVTEGINTTQKTFKSHHRDLIVSSCHISPSHMSTQTSNTRSNEPPWQPNNLTPLSLLQHTHTPYTFTHLARLAPIPPSHTVILVTHSAMSGTPTCELVATGASGGRLNARKLLCHMVRTAVTLHCWGLSLRSGERGEHFRSKDNTSSVSSHGMSSRFSQAR